METLVYNEQGILLTTSPTTYKIPSIQDIPREVRIDFFEGHPHPSNIGGSKAVGEPPFILGIAAWTARRMCKS